MTEHYDDHIMGKAYDGQMMRRLLGYLRPYGRHVALAIVLIILISALKIIGPYLTKIAIDRYIAAADLAGLGKLGLIYLAILVALFGLEYLQTFLLNSIGQRVMYDLRMQIFSHTQKLDVAYFDRTPVGRMMTRITSDVDALNELFTSGVVTIFGDIVNLSGIILALFLMNYRLAGLVFSVLPLIILVTLIFKIKVRENYRQVRKLIARMNSFLQESITGMMVIQIFGREPRKFQHFESINKDHLDANLQAILYYALFYPGIELLSAVSIGLVIWYGGGQVVLGAMTLGALVAFLQYSERFFQPISDLTEKYNILQTAMASAERIFTLLDTPSAIATPAEPISPAQAKGAIEFHRVWFAYKDENWVLRDISFAVKEGERLAIVGATGSGKTTLINLLTRFYDVPRGEILVDGINIKQMDLYDLRRRFSVVLQDVFLFSGTVESNIRLYDENITLEQVREAASLVHLDRFIDRLPKGYEEEVRERGSSFSVGEKQLLSFARALAFDPRILILDEATSSVDTETEILIQDAIQQLMKGRTSIVIAHRLSTIQDADRIIVLHKGTIRETGTHQELLAQRGIYHRLYQLQYKEQYGRRPHVTNVPSVE
ncbi:MAG: ABC transporter ATP-binding protein [Acidobacteria bacterium]|nr:ABC transporter ATP-binding protein [Acidobacteriota bacterium]MBI3658099.1 ABC transporter ATP-binding protein [Acidobacteriota bacterium]